jgi:hypothetical protein
MLPFLYPRSPFCFCRAIDRKKITINLSSKGEQLVLKRGQHRDLGSDDMGTPGGGTSPQSLLSPMRARRITSNGARQLRLLDFHHKADKHNASMQAMDMHRRADAYDKQFEDEVVQLRPNNFPFIDKVADQPQQSLSKPSSTAITNTHTAYARTHFCARMSQSTKN